MEILQNVEVLCTGGTFDKVYGAGVGVRNFTFPAASAVSEMIRRFGALGVSVDYDPALAKDSLDMTDADRQRIFEWCMVRCGSGQVIIHGTDTMIKTAEHLHRNLPLNARVILTGAAQPACVRDSDAEFNLGGALIAARMESLFGVFIIMNGMIHQWDRCMKDPVTGLFRAV